MSLILSARSPNFLNATNIPPPAKPAKMSLALMFSFIQLNTFPRTFPIFPAIVLIQVQTLTKAFPIPSKLPITEETPLPIPSKALDIISLTLEKPSPALVPSFNLVKKSPMDAAISRILSAIEPAESPVTKDNSGLRIAVNAFLPISNIENSPLNTDFTFLARSSERIRFLVKSLNLSVIVSKFLAVTGGNISRNASLIGLITLKIP